MHDIVPTQEGLAEIKPRIFVFGKPFIYTRDENLFWIWKKTPPILTEFIDKYK